MPGGNGTGPNGNNGCLTNNLEYGYFRSRRMKLINNEVLPNGMGRGPCGLGLGRGYGRGRGFGQGMVYGMRMQTGRNYVSEPLSKEDQIKYLKEEKKRIEQELKGLEDKI